MLFNSSDFLKFLLAFCLAYYLVRNRLRLRNLLVVFASYVFYGWWDWRFLGLIIISTLLDYLVGRGLGRTAQPGARRLLLAASVTGNLLILGFFKYYDFFAASLERILEMLGLRADLPSLGMVLPVGISFYTFQTMSYSFDVYRGVIPPTRDLAAFAAYVAFFPQLVAGPIERAHRLLPQFLTSRVITREMLAEGVWLFIRGMFKKVVIADSLAPIADAVFAASCPSAPAVLLGVMAFGLQIYCDFSGYSDIARGTAKFFGFNLMTNFDLPYLARSIRDFWHRWHISLSTWLRDYLYIPLGGNRRGPVRTLINIMFTMLLGGLWHGAAWHFVVWGAWHGLGLCAERVFPGTAPTSRRTLATDALRWMFTMLFVFYGWLLFRAASLEQAASMTLSLADWRITGWIWYGWMTTAVLGLFLCAVENPLTARICGRAAEGRVLGALLQGGMVLLIAALWSPGARPFIYFQF